MKFTKRNGYTGTIRKVWSDDKEVMYGLVGTVEDLLKEGVLEYCDYPLKAWCYIPDAGIMLKAWFGATREEAIANVPGAKEVIV